MIGVKVGAYTVLQQIGDGGMGSVWLAEHAMLGRRVALKVLHAEFSVRPDIVTRFFNEARAATAIADPGIVQIFDFGYHTDGSAYIVMELLDGEPLDRRLHRLGTLAIVDALRILRQVAASLGAAHAIGIVHRDLKPDNIILVRDPEVAGGERAKILDFGIAKLMQDPDGAKTQTQAMLGTPKYMSPEQCRGAGHVDQRSDVYALGCVLFALITGRPPFDQVGTGEIIAMHLREAAPVASTRAVGIPPEIDRLVARCLAKDPDERFASGTELAIAIHALLADDAAAPTPAPMPVTPRAPSAEPTPLTTLSTAVALVSLPAPPAARIPRGAMFAGFAAVGAIASWLVFSALHHDDPPRTDPPAAPLPAVVPPVVVPPPPIVTPAPPAAPVVDPAAQLETLMMRVLAGVHRWAAGHGGAPCPDLRAIDPELDEVTDRDPWGQPLALTCTDQPANQIVGAISAGPDGVFGSRDDIASWQLGHDVTDLVQGRRWFVAAAVAPPHAPIAKARPHGKLKPPPPLHPVVNDAGDGIPDRR